MARPKKLIRWSLPGGGVRIATTAHYTARMEPTSGVNPVTQQVYLCVVYDGRRSRNVVCQATKVTGRQGAVQWIARRLRQLEQAKRLDLVARERQREREREQRREAAT